MDDRHIIARCRGRARKVRSPPVTSGATPTPPPPSSTPSPPNRTNARLFDIVTNPTTVTVDVA